MPFLEVENLSCRENFIVVICAVKVRCLVLDTDDKSVAKSHRINQVLPQQLHSTSLGLLRYIDFDHFLIKLNHRSFMMVINSTIFIFIDNEGILAIVPRNLNLFLQTTHADSLERI